MAVPEPIPASFQTRLDRAPNGSKLTGLEPRREIVPHSGLSNARLQVWCSVELARWYDPGTSLTHRSGNMVDTFRKRKSGSVECLGKRRAPSDCGWSSSSRMSRSSTRLRSCASCSGSVAKQVTAVYVASEKTASKD